MISCGETVRADAKGARHPLPPGNPVVKRRVVAALAEPAAVQVVSTCRYVSSAMPRAFAISAQLRPKKTRRSARRFRRTVERRSPGTHTAMSSDNTLHAVPTGNQPTRPDTKNVSPTSASMSPVETPHHNRLNSQNPTHTALTSRCRTTTDKPADHHHPVPAGHCGHQQ